MSDVNPYTKAELERRRRTPLTSGDHTTIEVAMLLRQGKTYRQIAASWGMRPNAGANDLRYDVWDAWENAGSPGGTPQPGDGHRWNSAPWKHWRSQRDGAVQAWLATLTVGEPQHHCPTCCCPPAAPEPPREGEGWLHD